MREQSSSFRLLQKQPHEGIPTEMAPSLFVFLPNSGSPIITYNCLFAFHLSLDKEYFTGGALCDLVLGPQWATGSVKPIKPKADYVVEQ